MDHQAYMKSQGNQRLLQILKDGSNYEAGVAEAAKAELLERGYPENELEAFVALKEGEFPLRMDPDDPLDSIMLDYSKGKRANGFLLAVILLLCLRIVLYVISSATLVMTVPDLVPFSYSFFVVFLPMLSALFGAFFLWKRSGWGWVLTMFFAAQSITGQAFRYAAIRSLLRFNGDEGPASQGYLNLLVYMVLIVLTDLFIIYQINRSSISDQLQLDARKKVLGWVLLPAFIVAVYFVIMQDHLQ